MRVNGFGAISLLLLLCIVLHFLICQKGVAMRSKNIPQEKLEVYTAVADEYVQASREWKPGEYRLTFNWFDNKLELAAFSAVNLESLMQTTLKQKAEGYKSLSTDPTEFTIFVHTGELKAYEDTPKMAHPWREVFAPLKETGE